MNRIVSKRVSIYSINIFDKLKEQYKEHLRKDLISVYIIQTRERVYLESTYLEVLEDGLEKKLVNKKDLSIFVEGESRELTFDPENPIEINARKFIDEISPDLIMLIESLFNKDAFEEFSEEFSEEF